jgi:hypothetical protein
MLGIRRPAARLALAAAAAMALAACSDVIGPSGGGSISFTHTGVLAGDYSASGAVHWASLLPPVPDYGTYALAVQGTVNGGSGDQPFVSITGFHATTSPNGDFLNLSVTGLTGPGQVGFGAACSSGGPCAGGTFRPDARFQPDSLDPYAATTYDFQFVNGTVTITSMDSKTVSGTFSGTAVDVNDPSKTVTVTNGTFDVKFATGL